MIHGRPYQKEAVNCILTALETKRETVIDVCTGGGKTIIFAEIAKRVQPKRVLILAARRDLIFQAQAKVEKYAGLDCDIEMGSLRATPDFLKNSNVIVSSIQSQTPGRRMPPEYFSFVIIDEFHHVKLGNKSYMDVINHYRRNPETKFLGVTATIEPECLKVFPGVSFKYDILSAIKDGYLVNIFQHMVHIKGLDYSHIRTTAGDLNGADLAKVVEDEKVCQGMVQATLETQFGVPQHSLSDLPTAYWNEFLFADGKPKKNLIFTASVAQAKMMSDIFNRIIPNRCAWVCGNQNLISEEEREDIRKRFYSGDLLTVANCAVWGEGYDNPSIGMVTMAAATKSKTRYIQRVGRGTRTLEGLIDGIEDKDARLQAIASSEKPHLTILDFVGDSGRHSLITSAEMLGGESSEDSRIRARKKAEKSNKPENMSELLLEATQEILNEKKQREIAEAARKAHLVAKAEYHIQSADPFERLKVRFQGPSEWETRNSQPLSEMQRITLRESIGVDPDSISISLAKKMIGNYFNQPTPKQARILFQHGYPLTCTKREASAIIDRIKDAGWKRPPEDKL